MPAPQNPPRVEEPQAAYDPVAAGVQATRQLEQSGFARPQAEAVVLAVRELAGDLATKEDLAVTKSELKIEMANLRTEFKTDLARSETRLNKNAFRNTMWTVGILAAFMLAAITIATTIILAALPS
ncbi:MAG: hypothetical protein OXU31_05720 [Gammaproteobacteria bacterium]|nr:hypothetical protein [Gammaproteobacteria bacterium]